MDKQQAAREFEEVFLRYFPKNSVHREGGEAIWQAAQAALMPVLVEARYAFRAIETTGLNNVCSGWDAKHVRDHNITMAQNALARLNTIIGEK